MCTAPREGHPRAAMSKNPMGGSTLHKNWDPNASAWRFEQAEEVEDKNKYEVNNCVNCISSPQQPGWTNEYNSNNTALIDSTASLSLLHSEALTKLAQQQEPTKRVTAPNGASMQTTETLQINLQQLPRPARRGFRMPNIVNNLLPIGEICDAGYTVTVDSKKGIVQKDIMELLQGW
eukprot:13190444-Ditylum_brightwellii.AAC.1